MLYMQDAHAHAHAYGHGHGHGPYHDRPCAVRASSAPTIGSAGARNKAYAPPPLRQIPQGGHQSVTTAVASPMVKVREHCVGDACRGVHVRCRLARRASALDGVRPNICYLVCYMSCTLIGEPRKPVARGSTPTDDAVWAVLIFHVIFRTLPRFGDATRDV